MLRIDGEIQPTEFEQLTPDVCQRLIYSLLTDSQKETIQKTEVYVRGLSKNESTGHDWHHALRVRSLARQFAANEEVDRFIVELAGLLHDIDDPKITDSTSSHQAADFLLSVKVDPCAQEAILNIIENLSFSSHLQGKSVVTIEGKIVQDADRLEALGAIGIARTFAYGGRKNRLIYDGSKNDQSTIAHFYQKLLKLPELMNTETARLLANERVRFMNDFLREFFSEWEIENIE